MERELELSPNTKNKKSLLGRGIIASGAAAMAIAAFGGGEAYAKEPTCNYKNNPSCYWKITSSRPLDGYHRHRWINCVRFAKSRLEQNVTCSVAKARSQTATAQVGGKVQVGFGELSTQVGYMVNKTTTVTASDSVTVPANKGSGVIQWAALYGSRQLVTQEYQPCYQTAPGYFNNCQPQEHPRPENLAVAKTELFDSPLFRARITHK